MPPLLIITPEGRPLVDSKLEPLAEEAKEPEPFWIIAGREAERVSTKNHQQRSE
jgi:hypothetical protein